MSSLIRTGTAQSCVRVVDLVASACVLFIVTHYFPISSILFRVSVPDVLLSHTRPAAEKRILVSRAIGELLAISDMFPVNEASNNWVVSGAHTASGLPLLASDPHLRSSIPSVWYLCEMTGGTALHVAGGSLAGAPWVFIGHSEHMAWSATAMLADVQDLFLLKINPDNPDQVCTAFLSHAVFRLSLCVFVGQIHR